MSGAKKTAPAYTLFTAESATDLQGQVEAAMKKGWKCQGGVAVAVDSTASHREYTYAQAMVKP